MYEFHLSDGFKEWLRKLADATAKARILARIRAAEAGNFGDSAPVGEGVSEMRIHLGPGYRLYYVRRNRIIYLLLVGGYKSTQKRDIRTALQMARELMDD